MEARTRIEQQLALPPGTIAAEACRSAALATLKQADTSDARSSLERQLGLKPGLLSARGQAAHAALAAVVTGLSARPNGRAHLLPAGDFAARDGRPGPGRMWKLDDTEGMQIAAKITALAALTPIVIDYDHQTLQVQRTGKLAPAAGWIVSAEWIPMRGLFAAVEWTAEALAHIANGEYRFASAVIEADPADRVTGVALAALANLPAILGLDPVEAWSAS